MQEAKEAKKDESKVTAQASAPSSSSDDEKLPISETLKILDYRTLNKSSNWWLAAVLVESWGRKQICLYLWQRRGKQWKRKQKFAIQNTEQWDRLSECVEDLLPQLSK